MKIFRTKAGGSRDASGEKIKGGVLPDATRPGGDIVVADYGRQPNDYDSVSEVERPTLQVHTQAPLTKTLADEVFEILERELDMDALKRGEFKRKVL